uniref:Uncharacterized protein n=1 Tax=Pararge aegeria TaxID=116150 RepID=S4PJU0_9NEOP
MNYNSMHTFVMTIFFTSIVKNSRCYNINLMQHSFLSVIANEYILMKCNTRDSLANKESFIVNYTSFPYRNIK